MKKFFALVSMLSLVLNFVAFSVFAEGEAPAAAPTSTNPLMQYMGLIVPVGILVLMYFFLIRPQKKQEKQVAQMRNNVVVGDEISTNGGLIGRVVKVTDDIITIETGSDKTKLKVFRWAIRAVEVPFEEEKTENDK